MFFEEMQRVIHHDMGIRTRDSKRVDGQPTKPRFRLRKGQCLRWELEVPLFRDFAVPVSEPDVRRNDASFKREDGLDDGCNSRGSLGMADVALHSSNVKRLLWRPVRSEHLADRTGLDRVTDRRAGSMGFEETRFRWIESGLRICLSHERCLGFFRRCREAGRVPVVVGSRVADNSTDS